MTRETTTATKAMKSVTSTVECTKSHKQVHQKMFLLPLLLLSSAVIVGMIPQSQAFVVHNPSITHHKMTTTTTTTVPANTATYNKPTFLASLTSSSSSQEETTVLQETKDGDNYDSDDNVEGNANGEEYSSIVRAPLKYVGPYPCLALRFPDLSTSSQRAKNLTGIGLDFVLDTAANTNTINGQVAKELQLSVVGEALPGVGSAGAIMGGDTYMLGDAQLEGLMNNNNNNNNNNNTSSDNFIFMQNLTASALPVASPASAGLLSLAFMYCFEGGVEFNWGKFPTPNIPGLSSPTSNPEEAATQFKDGMLASSSSADLDNNASGGNRMSENEAIPSITFYGDENDEILQQKLSTMTRVQIEPVPVTQLPSIIVKINGVEMPALLDTGSPVTVLNSQAAKAAGLKTVELSAATNDDSDKGKKKNRNPFAAVADRFKEAQAMAQAASRGDVLTIAGTNGQPTNLIKTQSAIEFFVKGSSSPASSTSAINNDNDGGDGSANSNDTQDISFGTGRVYVGDLPGLAALNAIGVNSPPAVVLGMDVLRNRPKMLLRARDNEVYF